MSFQKSVDSIVLVRSREMSPPVLERDPASPFTDRAYLCSRPTTTIFLALHTQKGPTKAERPRCCSQYFLFVGPCAKLNAFLFASGQNKTHACEQQQCEHFSARTGTAMAACNAISLRCLGAGDRPAGPPARLFQGRLPHLICME